MKTTQEWTGKEDPWEGVVIDLIALQKIVCEIFRVDLALCGPPVSLRDEEAGCCGNHSRILSFELPTQNVVARLITPVKPLFKTEGEIAAMDFVRAHTTIPVPKVFSYCSEASNPVGAEWMIMEFVPGKDMSSVWDDFSVAQKQRLAQDIIDIHAQLSKLKASGCGGIYHSVYSMDDFDLSSRTPRWRPLSVDSLRLLREYCSHSVKDGYMLGPIHPVTLVNFSMPVPPPARTLPTFTQREYLNVLSRTIPPTPLPAYDVFTREACMKLFEFVSNLYPHSRILGPLTDGPGSNCFSHGDLHEENIFVDPDTGAITGVLDWESASFRPMWAEVMGVGWFMEDGHRMQFGCDEATNFEGETEEDARLRAFFRVALHKRDNDLFAAFLGGCELRAICDAVADWPPPWCQASVFLASYERLGYWNETRRGPFPWDFEAWFSQKFLLEHEFMRQKAELVSVQSEPSGSTNNV